MKKSIVLLATLFFSMMMISLVGVSMSLLSKSLEVSKSTKYIIQTNILLNNTVNLLKSKSSFIKDPSTLTALLNTPLSFKDKKSSLSVKIKLSSYASNININKLKPPKNSTKKTIYDIISAILLSENISDPQFFINIVLDSIDSDNEPRTMGSEIVNFDNHFEDGLIKSMSTFDQIVKYYYSKTSDENIFKIKWDKYIQFSSSNIDINYINEDLLGYILDLPKESVKELLKNKPIFDLNEVFIPQQVKILKDLSIKAFVPFVKCKVFIDVFEQKSQASFVYDLNTTRVSDVIIFSKH